jgi:hypothetical protein
MRSLCVRLHLLLGRIEVAKGVREILEFSAMYVDAAVIESVGESRHLKLDDARDNRIKGGCGRINNAGFETRIERFERAQELVWEWAFR